MVLVISLDPRVFLIFIPLRLILRTPPRRQNYVLAWVFWIVPPVSFGGPPVVCPVLAPLSPLWVPFSPLLVRLVPVRVPRHPLPPSLVPLVEFLGLRVPLALRGLFVLLLRSTWLEGWSPCSLLRNPLSPDPGLLRFEGSLRLALLPPNCRCWDGVGEGFLCLVGLG